MVGFLRVHAEEEVNETTCHAYWFHLHRLWVYDDIVHIYLLVL